MKPPQNMLKIANSRRLKRSFECDKIDSRTNFKGLDNEFYQQQMDAGCGARAVNTLLRRNSVLLVYVQAGYRRTNRYEPVRRGLGFFAGDILPRNVRRVCRKTG